MAASAFPLGLIFFAGISGVSFFRYQKASFAGGCFWCMTEPFEKLVGVLKVESGYLGGTGLPSYENYSKRGFVEAVEITYDITKINYSQLLNAFWRQINPTDSGGQFCDRGRQYRSVIFYHTQEQRHLANKSKAELEQSARFEKPIATQILRASKFYRAEYYHQDYYKKHPIHYRICRSSCGRDRQLQKIWADHKNRLFTQKSLL